MKQVKFTTNSHILRNGNEKGNVNISIKSKSIYIGKVYYLISTGTKHAAKNLTILKTPHIFFSTLSNSLTQTNVTCNKSIY